MSREPGPLSPRRALLKRLIRAVLAALLGFYLALFCFAFFFTEKTIFQPPPATYKDSDQILKLPEAGGTHLSAVYLPAPNARYTILYSHGNGEDLGELRPALEDLKQMGYSVLAYDYHGYGTTPGTPTEANAYQDEETAYDYLRKTRGVPADRIIAMGHSLGSAMAIDLAVRRPVAGLIIASAFVSADRIVTEIPILPLDKFENLAKIGRVHSPLLILHGEQDGTVPVWHGRMLYEAANRPKRAVWIAKAGHNNLFHVLGPRYEQTLKEFTAQLDSLHPLPPPYPASARMPKPGENDRKDKIP